MGKHGYKMNKLIRPERKTVFGSFIFNTVEEKLRLIHELREEFNNKVLLTVDKNIIMYEHNLFEE